jgi:hypothetical protein
MPAGLQFELVRNYSGVLLPVVTALVPDAPAACSQQVFVGDSIVACDNEACEGKSTQVLAARFQGLNGPPRFHLSTALRPLPRPRLTSLLCSLYS